MADDSDDYDDSGDNNDNDKFDFIKSIWENSVETGLIIRWPPKQQ
jgi:hypothetical protein